jgi:RNA polymerase sigma-70 factor (ECF subfamily)
VKRNHLTIKASLSSYLFRSLRNKIINHLRNESVYKKHIALLGQAHAAVTTANEAELWIDATDLERQIIYCLNKMPPKYREVYLLVINDANPVKETAGILHRPVATVERQLRVALRLLQEHLVKYKARLQ